MKRRRGNPSDDLNMIFLKTFDKMSMHYDLKKKKKIQQTGIRKPFPQPGKGHLPKPTL